MIQNNPKVEIKEDLTRVDGIPVFKAFRIDGKIVLEFLDQDRLRSTCRGSRNVRISLIELTERIEKLLT